MPSTITNFHSFTPGTKARSSEVNTNFSNFRGTILPIEANTAAASHNTHDLGASDHRWSSVYAGTVDLLGATTTSNLVLKNITAVTAGAAEMLTGSQTLASFNYGSFGFGGYTTTAFTKFQYQADGVGGILELLSGATTLTVFDPSGGIKQRTVGPLEWTSTSGGNAVGTAIILGVTSVSLNVQTTGAATICSFRFNARGGGVVRFGLANFECYGVGGTSSSAEVWHSSFTYQGHRGTTTTAMTLLAAVTGGGPIGSPTTITMAAVAPMFVDESCPAGEVVYQVRIVGSTKSFPGTNIQSKGRPYAEEL